VHGFTYSHAPVGAAVAREVLRILEHERLVEASAEKGQRLKALLEASLVDHANVGEVRGRGLLVGVELVADRDTREPFPRAARITEGIVAAAQQRGVLLYSGTGVADGVDGDTILLGPPFVVTDAELTRIADVVIESVDAATRGLETTSRVRSPGPVST
jgi:adenosylmethionine-8-amino-7-oxononanoate aminotransferase